MDSGINLVFLLNFTIHYVQFGFAELKSSPPTKMIKKIALIIIGLILISGCTIAVKKECGRTRVIDGVVDIVVFGKYYNLTDDYTGTNPECCCTEDISVCLCGEDIINS